MHGFSSLKLRDFLLNFKQKGGGMIISIEDVWKKDHNKYRAIYAMAKDAERINLSRKDETEELAETDEKVTVLAMKRFKEGKVKYRIVNPDETES